MPKYPKPDAEQEEWMNAPGGTPKGCEACGACDHLERCDHCGKCRNCGRLIALPYTITVNSPPAFLPYMTYPMYPWMSTAHGTVSNVTEFPIDSTTGGNLR